MRNASLRNSAANMNSDISAEQSVVLDVGVIGAGIAGLSAAIGLCRAGHRVEVCLVLQKTSDGHNQPWSDGCFRYSRGQHLQTKSAQLLTSVQMLQGFSICGVSISHERRRL